MPRLVLFTCAVTAVWLYVVLVGSFSTQLSADGAGAPRGDVRPSLAEEAAKRSLDAPRDTERGGAPTADGGDRLRGARAASRGAAAASSGAAAASSGAATASSGAAAASSPPLRGEDGTARPPEGGAASEAPAEAAPAGGPDGAGCDPRGLLSAAPSSGSVARSVVAYRGLKVGGTTLSQVLLAYLLRHDRSASNTFRCRNGQRTAKQLAILEKERGSCLYMLGTHHPPVKCFGEERDAARFCGAPESLVLFRSAAERLASAYRQTQCRGAGGANSVCKNSVQRYLAMDHESSKGQWFRYARNLKEAIDMAPQQVLFYSDDYDRSLLHMARRLGWSDADVMYVPLWASSWSESKVNRQDKATRPGASDRDAAAFAQFAAASGEQKWHDELLEAYKRQDLPDDAQVKRFRELQAAAHRRCEQDPALVEAVEEALTCHARVSKGADGFFHLPHDSTHLLSPMQLCMVRVAEHRLGLRPDV